MRMESVNLDVAPEEGAWKAFWREAYPCDEPSSVPYPRVPLYELLRAAARRFPERVACTLYGREMTYRDLDEQSRRLAASLCAQGAGPGRHVGLLLPNIPEYLVALQAVWLTGATALQLSPLMVAEEVAHWLKATDCRIVITLDLLAGAVTRSLTDGSLEHLILTSLAPRMAMWRGLLYRLERFRRNGYFYLPEDTHRHRYENLLQAETLAEPTAVNPAEDVAVLSPTGGTTASPKAVMLTHRNLVSQAFQLRQCIGGGDGTEGMLGVLPFFHAYGLSVTLLASWAKAATVHLYPRFETKAVLRLLLEKKPELVPAVPTMLAALNKEMHGKKHDLSFMRFVVSGASALPMEVRREFESHGVRDLVEGYGLTEAGPVTHVNLPGAGNHPGTIGVPVADTEAKLLSPDLGVELGPDEVGELVVRGPQVMKGYYHNPEASAAVLNDGWLRTGDMARRSADGYYTLVDRKKDIIKTSGFLVYPAEVEEVVKRFPCVADAAVIGVPDVERGEMVQALVVPSNGKLDVGALDNYCREHLSKHKRPRRIAVVRELPKNFLGKVLRRKLREAVVVTVNEEKKDQPVL